MNDLIDLLLEDAAEQMNSAVSQMRREYSKVRTGRATSSLIDQLAVEAYGVEMRLQELASFSVPEARMLVVAPHDAANVNTIEKAIVNANLGLAPSNDGRVIRLVFPPLTTERRGELSRLVGAMSEDGKQRINAVRRAIRKQLDALDSDGGVSADEIARAQSRLDALKNRQLAMIDDAQEKKQQELMEV